MKIGDRAWFKDPLKANVLLLVTAIIWGGGFVAQRQGMQVMGPFLFNAVRFFLGALVLMPLLAVRNDTSQPEPSSWKETLAVGCAAGLLLFGGASFQQLGLVYTTAGKAGFITGLYVIFVPLLGMVWGDRAPFTTWSGAVLALIGMYLLSATGKLSLAVGDLYVLVGALFWAGHVHLLAYFAPRIQPLKISVIQSLVTSGASFLVGLRSEILTLDQLRGAFWPLIYGGAISIGIAYTLQIVAQQSARPTPAAILLSMESVFAALLGWLILGEGLSPRALVGCGLMLGGMILAQVPARRAFLKERLS